MKTVTLHLYKAQDGLDAYAISRPGSDRTVHGAWLAQKGFGSDFEKVWTVELQSKEEPQPGRVDWENVLERAIEACHLSDPVIADYEWPSPAK
jgi:hypothetical protein